MISFCKAAGIHQFTMYPEFLSETRDGYTLPETNIVPENKPSPKETSIPTIHFQRRTVSFREGKGKLTIFPQRIEATQRIQSQKLWQGASQKLLKVPVAFSAKCTAPPKKYMEQFLCVLLRINENSTIPFKSFSTAPGGFIWHRGWEATGVISRVTLWNLTSKLLQIGSYCWWLKSCTSW